MRRPLLLDAFCCQGGASRGYVDAGWRVVGVDKDFQPHYPFPFLQMDALEALRMLNAGGWLMFSQTDNAPTFVSLVDFDSVHASPPCQARTKAQKIQGNDHPNLIAPTRELLEATGLPYVIENVVPEDAETDPDPLIDPVMLCGAMFGRETYRHRLFETNWDLHVPEHPEHVAPNTKMGRPPRPGEYMHIVGNFSGADRAREIMGMPWATRDGLREAIPPAYTEYIGRQLIQQIDVLEAAA